MFNRQRRVFGGARRFFSHKKDEMTSSHVPESQISRIYHYGSLVGSLGFGALGEGLRRATGSGGSGSMLLSEANLERMVRKLSQMRGAALKIGQLISFQDEKVIPPAIHQVLARLQSRANYMPKRQLEKVMQSNLGGDWRNMYKEFDEKPFAAASIGQVHRAVLKSGELVAVKVQYPGVANSIDSDLNTISLLLLGSRMLPEGMFLDKTIANARTELAWECDYTREGDGAKKFGEFLKDDDVFGVPRVYDEVSTSQVLTMEFMPGVEVSKQKWSQEEANWIATNIMRLCLLEIAKFKCMQTDPNWANFLYSAPDKKLNLLDFGATRSYGDTFIKNYIGCLRAAVKGDRQGVEDFSYKLGYLTGNESAAMKSAHVDSIMVLAEPFCAEGEYDFKQQTVSDRVRDNIGVMLRERLTPPPEETYGLHRKLSGVFLLCARMEAKVPCSRLFREIVGE